MWKRFFSKRRSIMLTWLLSYMAILAVPILISLFVYRQSQDILRSEIHRANNVLLKEVREVIDAQVLNAERLTTELTWNVRIRAFMYSSQFKTPGSLNGNLYDLHMTAKEMAIYQSLYPAIKTYYVYWKNQDLVLEPGVYRDSRLAYETIHQDETISYQMWLDILKRKNSGEFIKLENKNRTASTLAFLHSFPGEQLNGSPGTAAVLLDTSQLLETLRNVQNFSNGQVLVLNRSKQVLISTETDNDPLYLANLAFDSDSGSYYAQYQGKQSEFMYIKSKNSQLIYVTVVPNSQVWQKTDYLRNITYAGLLISLLGGGLLAILLLRRNYSPVQQLLHMLQGEEKPVFAKGNEFLHIRNAISTTLSEKGQIELQMKQQANALRSNMLARMMKGKLGNPLTLDESLSAFDIRFESQQFAVLLFYLDYQSFFEHMEGMAAGDKPRLLQFIVANVVEDLARGKHSGFVCEIDDNMACLVNFKAGSGDTGQLEADALALAEEARQFLGEKFKIHAIVAISELKTGLEQIPQAYREAVDALEYRIVVGGRETIAYRHLSRDAHPALSNYYYPIQVEQQLINHVKAGDARQAEALIREIIERNMEQSVLSVELIKSLMFNLISTLIKTIGEIGSVEESAFLSNSIRLTDLMNCDSIKEMERQLSAVVQEVCDYTLAKQKELSVHSRRQTLSVRSNEIIAYISGNYQDANLNISRIGEHFGMTPTYLSKLFKDQTGKGLLDTINEQRLETAKQLLKDPHNTIKWVAAQVGFHDINTFIRTFKKYEGITPGQYQKIL